MAIFNQNRFQSFCFSMWFEEKIISQCPFKARYRKSKFGSFHVAKTLFLRLCFRDILSESVDSVNCLLFLVVHVR